MIGIGARIRPTSERLKGIHHLLRPLSHLRGHRVVMEMSRTFEQIHEQHDGVFADPQQADRGRQRGCDRFSTVDITTRSRREPFDVATGSQGSEKGRVTSSHRFNESQARRRPAIVESGDVSAGDKTTPATCSPADQSITQVSAKPSRIDGCQCADRWGDSYDRKRI